MIISILFEPKWDAWIQTITQAISKFLHKLNINKNYMSEQNNNGLHLSECFFIPLCLLHLRFFICTIKFMSRLSSSGCWRLDDCPCQKEDICTVHMVLEYNRQSTSCHSTKDTPKSQHQTMLGPLGISFSVIFGHTTPSSDS